MRARNGPAISVCVARPAYERGRVAFLPRCSEVDSAKTGVRGGQRQPATWCSGRFLCACWPDRQRLGCTAGARYVGTAAGRGACGGSLPGQAQPARAWRVVGTAIARRDGMDRGWIAPRWRRPRRDGGSDARSSGSNAVYAGCNLAQPGAADRTSQHRRSRRQLFGRHGLRTGRGAKPRRCVPVGNGRWLGCAAAHRNRTLPARGRSSGSTRR